MFPAVKNSFVELAILVKPYQLPYLNLLKYIRRLQELKNVKKLNELALVYSK